MQHEVARGAVSAVAGVGVAETDVFSGQNLPQLLGDQQAGRDVGVDQLPVAGVDGAVVGQQRLLAAAAVGAPEGCRLSQLWGFELHREPVLA